MSTELMLRLIKDGKIVGKRCTLTLGEAKKHLDSDEYEEHQWARCYKDEDMVDIYYVYSEKHPEYTHFTTDQWTLCIFARYDSFDMGIKVGEEWHFANSIYKYHVYERAVLQYGSHFDTITQRESVGWYFDCPNEANELFHACSIDIEDLGTTKRIGSIYDKDDK